MEEATRHHFFNHGAREPTGTKASIRVLPHSVPDVRDREKTPANLRLLQALEREKDNCQWCQIRRFPNNKECPITIVNDVDDAVLPSTFRFLQESQLGTGVQAAEDSFRSGCECVDAEECQYRGCLCLQEQDDASDDEDAGERKKVYMYHMHGSKAGLLRSKYLSKSKRPIYECHEGCACSQSCPNRVVERGRKVPLQIFRTEDGRGWGA